jgi:dethiobiotin synthetase
VSPRGVFVAGTDTGVGKTLVAAALLHAAAARGLRCAGVKPVAAGCEWRDGHWVNEDALLLQAAATLPLDYAEVNPVALPPAIAPHIAAAQAGLALEVTTLVAAVERVRTRGPDLLVVEGAGGWLVPLSARETMADLAACLGLPVVLVVGLRLGCLNHALLTARAIAAAGLPLAGWVGNTLDPEMPVREENLATLRALLPAPCLGVIPDLGRAAAPASAAGFLDLSPLLD